MEFSIIGSGKIGVALAGHFASAGIPVAIANSRGADTLASLVAALGGKVKAVSLAEAATAKVIILAVPFRAYATVALAADWQGKVIIDAMNAFGVSQQELGGRPSSVAVAAAFIGAQVVKAFNHVAAALLAQDPVEPGGNRVMFLSGDDEPALNQVSKLARDFGFAPIVLGSLASSSPLTGVGGALLLHNLVKLA